MNQKLIAIIASLALIIGVAGLFTGNTVTKLTENVGVVAGPTFTEAQYFLSGITVGGSVYATSTSGATIPLLANMFDDESAIDVTLDVQDATLSFPASTTVRSLDKVGDTKTFYVRNASTTAAMDITFTGGTGMLLKKATTSAVLYGDTDGANYGQIQLIRKANKDIEVLYTPFVD